ncbi:MAG: hypothetical protein HOV81_44525 [Kofleriaceae bacterium]|nr:hypothetical protein [Kofleriaceae bacterium]
MTARVLVLVCLVARVALAQTPPEPAPADPYVPSDPAAALREANGAATAGDWERVAVLVQPLLAKQLDKSDLAEAHRLAGIAALFVQPPRRDLAEEHFLAYLRIDLDGHLDPALYPPEVVTFFNDVRARHAAELRALRPKGKRYAVLTLVPPFGQFQNGERTKGWIIAGALGAFAATNVTSVLLLRRWCTTVSREGKSSRVCDEPVDHYDEAKTARSIQILSAVGLIATYVYGVYDGVRGYRRETRERTLVPYATPTNTGGMVGVSMNF